MSPLAADAPERSTREVLERVVCGNCGLETDIDPKDDRDCPMCEAVDSLERP
jgi:rubrerythrin